MREQTRASITSPGAKIVLTMCISVFAVMLMGCASFSSAEIATPVVANILDNSSQFRTEPTHAYPDPGDHTDATQDAFAAGRTPSPEWEPTSTASPTPQPRAPEPGELVWERVEEEQESLWRLTGLNARVRQIEPAPGGEWWALELSLHDLGQGIEKSALVIVNPETGAYWLPVHTGYTTHVWLPDGRLAWTLNGKMYVAGADGSDRREIASPEGVRKLWLVRGKRLFVAGSDQLWRLDLDGMCWDEVVGISDQGVRLGSPYDLSSNLVVSSDGELAAVIQRGNIWRVPWQSGAPAEWLGQIEHPGRDEHSWPVIPLTGPYWVINAMLSIPHYVTDNPGALLEVETGKLVSLREALEMNGLYTDTVQPVDRQTLEDVLFGGYFQFPHVSPDQHWIALPNGRYTYIGAVDDIDRGLWIKYRIDTWISDPPTVIVNRTTGEDGSELIGITLPDGDEMMLVEHKQTPQSAKVTVYAGGSVYASLTYSVLRVTWFNADFTQTSSANLELESELDTKSYISSLVVDKQGNLMFHIQGSHGPSIFYFPAGST